MTNDPHAAAREAAIASLSWDSRYQLGFPPIVGDLVVVNDSGDGWAMALTGTVTEIDAMQLTVGNGYSLDWGHPGITIKPYVEPEPARDVADLIQQVEDLTAQLAAKPVGFLTFDRQLVELQNEVNRQCQRVEDAERKATEACEISGRYRRALKAAGVPDWMIDALAEA